MSVPLWVPWVLVLSLAWPAVLAVVVSNRDSTARGSRGLLVAALVPALLLGVVVVAMTVDRTSISQDEIDDAAVSAARALDGSLGAVDADRVALLLAAELDHDVDAERSELSVADEVNASYEIEVRPRGDDEPAACVEVALELMDPRAPDLRFADVTARSGPCG